MNSNDETITAALDEGSSCPSQSIVAKTVGDFTLIKSIGRGAMGEVYLAERHTSTERVALKLITNTHAADEAFIQRFNREIAILSRLDHPNIGRAIAFGLEDGHPYLAMEFIDGPNLGDVLRERGALFEPDVLRIAIHVARGLAYAHTEAGLIHRDIKPANLLIAQEPGGDRTTRLLADGDQVKIIDFGLAKSVDTDDQRLTLTGIVMGTPSYMSPEQIRSDATIDFHTDVYALGATMFHLLTGRIPFPSDIPALVMVGHLNDPVPDPGALVPSLSPLTRQLVMTALAKSPQNRFVDYRGLIHACEKALNALGHGSVGTMRMLRKPMVRSGSPVTPLSGSPRPPVSVGDFVPMAIVRETTSITKRIHKPPATGAHALGGSISSAATGTPSTRMFASDAMQVLCDPLEARNGSSGSSVRPAPRAPASHDRGSQALRKAYTDKIERVKTTRRINRLRADQEAVPAAAGNGTVLTLNTRLQAMAPLLLLGTIAAILLSLWLVQVLG